MPEDDNSILGESVYQHLRYEERDSNHQPVDLKMFEQHQQHQQQQEAYSQHQVDLESLNQSEYGDWSREEIYQSISRGQLNQFFLDLTSRLQVLATSLSSRRSGAATCWSSTTSRRCPEAPPARSEYCDTYRTTVSCNTYRTTNTLYIEIINDNTPTFTFGEF